MNCGRRVPGRGLRLNLGSMDINQLEVLVTVARERSFSRAAEILERTQPAVSQAIRRLEAEIGETLFDRSSKGRHSDLCGRGAPGLCTSDVESTPYGTERDQRNPRPSARKAFDLRKRTYGFLPHADDPRVSKAASAHKN